MEDIWTQNIVNIFVSPLKIWEWIVATFLYGIIKITIIVTILSLLAIALYHFDITNTQGLYLIPMAANLLLFGWAIGMITAALVIRWGHAAEALIWGIPFLIQPLSASFYPLSILPIWCQWIALGFPSTYIFEGMRQVIQTGSLASNFFIIPFLLNGVYLTLSFFIFRWLYRAARNKGRLARLGMD